MQNKNRYLAVRIILLLLLYPFTKIQAQNLPINNSVINSGQHVYYSPGTITSPDTNCNQVLIAGNAQVDYKAAQYIHLKGGFKTDLSSGCGVFHAYTGTQPTNCPTPIITGPHYYCGANIPNLSAASSISGGGSITSYQWQVNGQAISGATNVTHLTTVSGNYAVRISNSLNCTVISSEFLVTVNGSSASFTGGQKIYNVTLAGASTDPLFSYTNGCTIVAPGPGSLLNQYSNFKTLGSLVTVSQGSTIPFSIAEAECDLAPYYPFKAAIYIDYNHDGFYYDLGEEVYLTASPQASPQTISGSFIVPLTAMIGQTSMRVMVYDANSTLGPCGGYPNGETEDYSINIIPPQPCTGAPNPGNTLASKNPACLDTMVNLSLQNIPTVNGVTFQWYNNGGVIVGATNSTYSFIMNTQDDYYCAVTCADSGLTTNSIPVTVALKSFIDCYCGAASFLAVEQQIYNVTVAGDSTNPLYANVNGCTTAAPGPGSILNHYSNFKTLGNLTAISQGNTVPFTIVENECGIGSFQAFGAAIWIDFNHNASFSDPGEKVFGESVIASGPRNISGSFLVPMSALNGPTVMRVRIADGLAGLSNNILPCGNLPYGEVEDYLINIGTVSTNSTINIKLIIEGYWDGVSGMFPVLENQLEPTTANACDSIDVELRENVSPYGVAASIRTVLNQNGTAVCNFPPISGNFYIAVKHRSGIQTWSADPISAAPSSVPNYDFSIAQSKAYGANQIEVSLGVWAFFSGDVVADENIDLLDISELETYISNFAFGYEATDINGDGNVDLLDIPYVEANSSNFIFSAHP